MDNINTNYTSVALINGKNGKFDGKIQNPSVKYARNAIDNYKKTYPSDPDTFQKTFFDKENPTLQIKDFPPLDFKMQYAPKKSSKPDTMALIAAAFEEMGQRFFISVEELTNQLKAAFGGTNQQVSAKALDLNNDGKVDLAEYSTSILLEDINSEDSSSFGEIDNQGQLSILPYANIKNQDVAKEHFNKLFSFYKLADAQSQFLKDSNNSIIV